MLALPTARTERAPGEPVLNAVARALALSAGLGKGRRSRSEWTELVLPNASCSSLTAVRRGEADALGFARHYCDPPNGDSLRPESAWHGALFDALARARAQGLGAARYPGSRLNLLSLHVARLEQPTAETSLLKGVEYWFFEYFLRALLGGPSEVLQIECTVPDSAFQGLIERFRPHGPALLERIQDEAAYLTYAVRMLADVPGDSPVAATGGTGATRCVVGPDPVAMTEATQPQAGPPAAEADLHALAAPAGWAQPDGAVDAGPGEGPPAAALHRLGGVPHSMGGYRVFTRDHDEVRDAQTLASADTLLALSRRLEQLAGGHRRNLMRMSTRLQRALLAPVLRDWLFDQDSGVLDSARLARVLASPGKPLAFRRERERPQNDTLVTLLIDNSGSMRGRPIALAALTAELLASALERCAVRTEILGFTTGEWKGGRSREQWLRIGRPECPGRLTDLRHVVYKRADQPLRRTRRALAAMLIPGLLKENVDGEALLWAHSRALAVPAARRVMIVVSDGSAADDATASANDPDYLQRHLKAVTRWIDADTRVQLIGIGIGYDLRDTYRRALMVESADRLGEALCGELVALLAPKRYGFFGRQ